MLDLPSGGDSFATYTDASKDGLGWVLIHHGKVNTHAFRKLKPHK